MRSLAHELSSQRQRQQRGLQGSEDLFQDDRSLAFLSGRFPVINILQSSRSETVNHAFTKTQAASRALAVLFDLHIG